MPFNHLTTLFLYSSQIVVSDIPSIWKDQHQSHIYLTYTESQFLCIEKLLFVACELFTMANEKSIFYSLTNSDQADSQQKPTNMRMKTLLTLNSPAEFIL